MKKEFRLLVGFLLPAAVLAGACNISVFGTEDDPSSLATQSAKLIAEGRSTQTAIAKLTAAAATVTWTATPPELFLEYTSTPTSISLVKPQATNLAETQIRIPSFTPLPTITPLPSFTLIAPKTTEKPIPCYRASFVKDLTVPDGSIFPPGSSFSKSWRLLNSGTCTWTSNYGIVFVSGEKMNGQSPKLFGAEVKPGQTVDVSITLTAPAVEGTYTSNWQLRNANGETFGTTTKASNNDTFYAKIVVKKVTTNYAVDFVSTFCAAEWVSSAGLLACPGTIGNPSGMVQRIDSPVLETGATDNEPALLTIPQAVTDGVIHGKYPWYTVVDGDNFRTVLGCADDAKTCNVKFNLDYILDGETTIRNLASWGKTWDGSIKSVTFDLSGLAGKKVRFVLTVVANGETRDNRAMWLAPRILHK